ncbi:MAG: type IV pilus secretin PilQ [Acidobacteria bacterium]|nr:type IV pilus secretin PilQ [Acidobacteriota bacterium]
MTSLQFISGIGKKAVIAIIFISTLALAVAAQRVEPQQQGKRYGDPGFRGEPINLNVVNADVRDILNYITEQYGINFVIDKSVGKIPVTVNVSDVPWNIALDSVMRSQELGIQVNGNILRVADAKVLASEGEIFRAQQNNQLDSSPLYTEFIRLNYARALGTLSSAAGSDGPTAGTITGAGAGGGAGGGSGTTTGAAGGDQGILGIIKRRLSRRGAVEVDGRTNTLIVTDVRENIDAVRQLVTLLDQPEPQVEIETRIVVASRSFSRDVGVQLSAFLGGTNRGAFGSTLPNAPVDPRIPVPPSLPNGNIQNNLASQIANTAIGLTTGVFGTAQINLLITAGEKKGQVKVIATPRVTTLNNRKAEIKSGLKVPITTVQPGSAAGGAVITTTQYVDVPLKLEVTPQITDVGTVILNLLAENSSLSEVVAGATAPGISTQSMQTEVVVPDGGTTVIGGVLSDDEREGVNRTPGLSRIPFFGNLFKRKNVSRETAEILFFITPRVYKPEFAGGAGATRPATTTIVQPVPLGNPPSNSDQVPPVVPITNPVVPVVQPSPTPKGQ